MMTKIVNFLNINPLMWVVCWFNERHIMMKFSDGNGGHKSMCIRCGKIEE